MKLSTFAIAAVAAEDKKVPPRHPLNRLNKLRQFSETIIDYINYQNVLPSKDAWIRKFANLSERMERNFNRGNQRCGYYNEDQLPHGGPERKRREDDDDFDWLDSMERGGSERLASYPLLAIRQTTTGYKKWAQRYLSQCSGQKKHNFIVNRMKKWNRILTLHIDPSFIPAKGW